MNTQSFYEGQGSRLAAHTRLTLRSLASRSSRRLRTPRRSLARVMDDFSSFLVESCVLRKHHIDATGNGSSQPHDMPYFGVGGDLTPMSLHHSVRLDTDSADELPPRQSSEFREPLQPLAEVLWEKLQVGVLCPIVWLDH